MNRPSDRPPKRLELVEQNDTDERGTEGRVNGNGGHRPSMHPEAVQALAEHTATKQAADERVLERLEESLAQLHEGRTPWQRDVKALLATMTNKLNVLAVERFVRPPLLVLTAIALGAFAAELVLRLATH